MRFSERMARMMAGRNGTDSLNNFNTIVALIITLVNVFFHSILLTLTATTLFIVSIWRSFSRDLRARQKENMRFLKAVKGLNGRFKLMRNKIRDRKTHVYKKCTKCKAVLRLPKKKGHHTVVCPKCGERFEVNV